MSSRQHNIPPALLRDLSKYARELRKRHREAFNANPQLRHAAGRVFVALLPPRPRRAGRPCELGITTAARLLKRYRKRFPAEPAESIWARIYPAAIPGFKGLPHSEKLRRKRLLRAGVRSRKNTRRRRSKRQNIVSQEKHSVPAILTPRTSATLRSGNTRKWQKRLASNKSKGARKRPSISCATSLETRNGQTKLPRRRPRNTQSAANSKS